MMKLRQPLKFGRFVSYQNIQDILFQISESLQAEIQKMPPWHHTKLSPPAEHYIVHHPWPAHLADGPCRMIQEMLKKGKGPRVFIDWTTIASQFWQYPKIIWLTKRMGFRWIRAHYDEAPGWSLKDHAISPLPGRYYKVMFRALPSTARHRISATWSLQLPFCEMFLGCFLSQGGDRRWCLWRDESEKLDGKMEKSRYPK